MKLLTKKIATELVRRDALVLETGTCPDDTVVRYFTPDASGTWEIYSATPLDAINGGAMIVDDQFDYTHAKDWHMFGRCDLGMGSELGYVLLSQLEGIRGSLGLPVERDLSVGFS